MLPGALWLVLLYVLGALFGPRHGSQASDGRAAHGRSAFASTTSPESWLDPTLGTAVTLITHQDNGIYGHNGLKGRVRCWSREGWKKRQADWGRRYRKTLGPLSAWRGYTIGVPRKEIELPPDVCGELSTLENEGLPVWRSDWPDGLAFAVGVLAHEARHFSGALDEWSTECYGVQSIRDVTVGLGRAPREGEYLARLYWRHVYQRRPLAYRPPQCRNGGEWDLRPRSGLWP